MSLDALANDAARHAARNEIARLRERTERAEGFIEQRGYRRCDIAACNCGSWHGGHLTDRLREIEDALNDADVDWQGTTKATVAHALADLTRLRAEVARLTQERDDALRLEERTGKAARRADHEHRTRYNALKASRDEWRARAERAESKEWQHALAQETRPNDQRAQEGHCRVPHVPLEDQAVRDIARGYYHYREDYPTRIGMGGSLLTPTVDQVMQTLAARLCEDHAPAPPDQPCEGEP